MKVGEFIDLLSKFNPMARIIIHRDANNYGYGYIDTIKTGLFMETDYGNDFFVDQKLVINPEEVKAVCIYPEDSKDSEPPKSKSERTQ